MTPLIRVCTFPTIYQAQVLDGSSWDGTGWCLLALDGGWWYGQCCHGSDGAEMVVDDI